MTIKVRLPHKFEFGYIMFPWQETTLSYGWRITAIMRTSLKKFRKLINATTVPVSTTYKFGTILSIKPTSTLRFLDQTSSGIAPHFGAYARKIQSSSRVFRGTPTAEYLNQLAGQELNICPIDKRPNTYAIPGGKVFDYQSSTVLRILKSRPAT